MEGRFFFYIFFSYVVDIVYRLIFCCIESRGRGIILFNFFTVIFFGLVVETFLTA